MRLVKALVLIAVIVVVVPPMAAAEDLKNSLGLAVGYLGPTGTLDTDWVVGEVSTPTEFKFESTGIVGLTYQHRFSERLSLGAAYLYGTPDLKATSSGKSGTVGNAVFSPLLLDANIHVLKGTSSVDFFVGPTLGWGMWGDLKPSGYAGSLNLTTSQKLNSDYVYGLNFGLDVPFKTKWAFNAGVRYLWVKAEQAGGGGLSLDVNPWIGTVGVSVRF